MPAHQRRDQVGGAEDVEAAAERRAGDAVERGSVPGYLRFVDGEVRGYGPVEALLHEDFVRVGRFDVGCCYGSVGCGLAGWGNR